MPAHAAIVTACGLLAAVGLAGCGSRPPGGAVAVTATDTGCRAARTTLSAGTTTFAVTNAGNAVTEFVVYGPGGAVQGKVANIGPGVTRNLTVELGAGGYEGACRPGVCGDGIRVVFSVTGPATPLAGDPAPREATGRYRSYVVTEPPPCRPVPPASWPPSRPERDARPSPLDLANVARELLDEVAGPVGRPGTAVSGR